VGHISACWSLPNSAALSLRNKIITAAAGGAFWIEEQDRSAAIKVISAAAVEKGNAVSAAGVLGQSGAQRALFADSVENFGGWTDIPPVGMQQRSLGGSDRNAFTPGITGCRSLYNIGLLVRCAGQVTYYNNDDPRARYFYFDDGSGVSSGGYRGVKVICGSVSPPTSGMVIVTGIIGSEQDGANVVPVIIIRSAADIWTL